MASLNVSQQLQGYGHVYYISWPIRQSFPSKGNRMTQRYFLKQITISLIALLLSSALVMASPSNKWRLQFSGNAHSDGVIVVKLTPVGGQPITVPIAIAAKTSENRVAKIVVETLRESLPADAFHVERDDGEDVLIKKRHKAASFDLEIVSNSIEHVRVRPDRE